jgi:hypothetical protein
MMSQVDLELLFEKHRRIAPKGAIPEQRSALEVFLREHIRVLALIN